jgi:serine/threonine protein kinase
VLLRQPFTEKVRSCVLTYLAIACSVPDRPQVDVYAFGIVLWEMAAREPIFSDVGFLSAISAQVVSGARPPLPSTCNCPPAYAAILRELWQHDPEQRPSFAQSCKPLELLVGELALKEAAVPAACLETVRLSKKVRARLCLLELLSNTLCSWTAKPSCLGW